MTENNTMRQIKKILLIVISLLLLNCTFTFGTLVWSFWRGSLVFIESDQLGVVVSSLSPVGYRSDVLLPGEYHIIPYFEAVQVYTTALQIYTFSSEWMPGEIDNGGSVLITTKDGQKYEIDAKVDYYINPDEAIDLFLDYRNNYLVEFIIPTVERTIRRELAQLDSVQLFEKSKDDLELVITEQLRLPFENNHLKLHSLQILEIRDVSK